MNTGKRNSSMVVACSLALCALPAAFAGKDGDKRFKMMDTNGDGKISRTEHVAGAKQMFAQSDANRDGVVTVAEMDAVMAAQAEKPGKHDKTSVIQAFDQNADGQLTVAEHDAGTEMMFAQMDTDGDGSLNKAECEKGQKPPKKDT